MKAVVCTKYGPPEVLQLTEVEKPESRKGEVRIKIYATSVTASDCIVRGFNLPLWNPVGFMMGLVVGFGKPRNPLLGMELAGEVESTGSEVKRFKEGDHVYGTTIGGPFTMRFGTYAEYKCLPEDSIIDFKPDNVTFEEAAAVPYGGLIAMHYLKKGDIQNRQNVLIYGASGAIGTSAVQLAGYHGAQVSGVCSTRNVDLVKSLGAKTVIDYTKQDHPPEGESYDFIFDAVGKRKSSKLKEQSKKSLTPGGRYISVDDGSPRDTIENLRLLSKLLAEEKLKPVIDREFSLDQIVEAHRYVDQGHKRGNVVVTVSKYNQ